ncbi:ATP-binding cassette, subfamily B [Clostridium sp. USBA 49]|jgi:ATP-binding cassette subfamily B protein|uniref:ABC transporter ATP-binding protein n=1 Tax=Clostridium TaxID=1485 RepID=UPI000999854B|nr:MULTISPECIES: ABC transporter ATP-binding protein [Clostridium]SKA84263.1 ATP-binding cassette, subfamily B [Clostridium sp. USBA 49]
MKAIKWIYQYIKEYKLKMFLGLFAVVICSALNMINPYMSGFIVDKIINGGQKNLLLPVLLLMIFTTIIKTVIRYFYQLNFEKISQAVIFNIRDKMYSYLQNQDFYFFDSTRTGDIMTRMTADIDAVRHFIAWVIYNIFDNVLIFLFAIITMFTINVKFTFIMLSITPFTAFFAYKLSKTVKGSFAAIRHQFSKLNTVVEENISGNRVVKAFTQEDYEIKKFSKVNSGYKEKNLQASKIWEKYLPILDSLASILVLVLILIGGIMVINKNLTLGELITFNSLIWAINNPLRMAGWLINDVQRFAASGEKIMEFMIEKPRIKNALKTTKKDKIEGYVEFRDVTFSYGDEPVLKNINLKVNPGEKVAIIGPTGSGKSSLISLICRFYDCTSGEIFIDGINIKDLDIVKLRQNISIAMQDIFLFSDTIEGNISYAVPDAPISDITWVSKIAGAHNFIENMPEGYETIVGERGVGLSGGQKQRIALARALIKNPSILILDDTTSSVDVETEHEIQNTLNSYFKNKTTFIIAHRISSVKDADKILVLKDGEIVEEGNHKELINKKGYYYKTFINQLGDFNREEAV